MTSARFEEHLVIKHQAATVIPFYRPEPEDPAKSGAHLTVDEFYRRYKLPELQESDRATETVREYQRHVRRWAEWLANDRIENPVVRIRDVSRADLLDWRTWLRSAKGINASPRTANKHLGSLQAILAAAGERGAHPAPPRLKPLETVTAARKDYLTYDQVGALYEAADAAQWPTADPDGKPLPYSPAVYWRTFLAMQFNYGQRTQELWSYERAYDTLTWRQVWWEPETPAPEGNAENSHGWFYYTPPKQKRAKPEPLVLPLNETAARHLRAIVPPGGAAPDARVFPCPYGDKKFYEAWEAIVAASGVRLKVDLDTGERPPVHIKLLRKTCETWHDTHSPGMGEIVTGHAERSVSGKHYANRERRLVEAVNALPQPAAFNSTDQQQRLF